MQLITSSTHVLFVFLLIRGIIKFGHILGKLANMGKLFLLLSQYEDLVVSLFCTPIFISVGLVTKIISTSFLGNIGQN